MTNQLQYNKNSLFRVTGKSRPAIVVFLSAWYDFS